MPRAAGILDLFRTICLANRDHPSTLRKKWVHQTHPGGDEIADIARDDCEVMNQCRRGNLLIERIFRVRNAKATPNLRDFPVERQDRVAVLLDHEQQPALQSIGLLDVATVANLLYASTKFPNGNCRHVQGFIIKACFAEKRTDADVRPISLPGFADDVGIYQVHRSVSSIGLLAHKVGVLPDIGHSRKDIGKPPPLRSAQRRLQNLAMSFLGASALCSGPPFQGLHEVLIEIPHHQLRHDNLRIELNRYQC
jgi:hypothetical protein